LTTQYLEEADRLADDIAVIDEGRVIAQGTSDELKSSIGGQHVELSLVSDEDCDTAVRILREVSTAEPEVSSDRRTLAVTVTDGPHALQAVLAKVKEHGIRLHDAGMRRPTLDDVFLQLTGHAATLDEEEAKNP
jgi:ABC-2 type transport system ATP-binding protein